jgi:hypothetical protein
MKLCEVLLGTSEDCSRSNVPAGKVRIPIAMHGDEVASRSDNYFCRVTSDCTSKIFLQQRA